MSALGVSHTSVLPPRATLRGSQGARRPRPLQLIKSHAVINTKVTAVSRVVPSAPMPAAASTAGRRVRVIARTSAGADEAAAAAVPAPIGRKKTAVVVGGVGPSLGRLQS